MVSLQDITWFAKLSMLSPGSRPFLFRYKKGVFAGTLRGLRSLARSIPEANLFSSSIKMVSLQGHCVVCEA